MTEEEARTKWCPFARVAFAAGAGNRFAETPDDKGSATLRGPCLCIGSACMAWRWNKGYRSYLDLQNGDLSQSLTQGGCGLAGPTQ